MTSLKALVFVTSILALSGCATTLVGGLMENEIEVLLDNNSIPVTAKNMLISAKTLGVVSSDRSSIKAADLFETRGGYIVKIDRLAAKVGEMTGSERREALINVCKTAGVDVALLGRVVNTESGNMAASMITGRAKLNKKWTMDIYSCRTNSFDAFGGSLNMNLGIYTNKPLAEMEEKVGAEIGGKILVALGRDSAVAATKGPPPAQPAGVQATEVSSQSSQASTLAASRGSATLGGKSSLDERKNTGISMKEVQQRLLALGYNIGVADGLAGKKTLDAIKKFQYQNQLPASGVADDATLNKLGLK